MGAQEFEPLGRAVVGDEHVLDDVLGDTGCHGCAATGAVHDVGAHEHLVVDAVEAARRGDARAPGNGAREAHGGEHRLRTGVGERGTLGFDPPKQVTEVGRRVRCPGVQPVATHVELQ